MLIFAGRIAKMTRYEQNDLLFTQSGHSFTIDSNPNQHRMKLQTLQHIARRHSVIVLFSLLTASFSIGFHSYSSTEEKVTADMGNALMLAMQEQEDVITADTIRLFNDFLRTEELRGKATLVVGTRHSEKGLRIGSSTVSAHCSKATVLAMSNQWPTLFLLSLTMLWVLFCRTRIARQEVQGLPLQSDLAASCYGGISFFNGEFYASATGEHVKLTPMQHQLMEMFFLSPSHSLSKHEIYDTLWPKKMDASETLYTLIRRLRPIIERHSDLRIESDRSKAYRLVADN